MAIKQEPAPVAEIVDEPPLIEPAPVIDRQFEAMRQRALEARR